MGHLNSIGSSKALRRSLFPQGFAGEVMALLLDTWQVFSMHQEVRLEEPITAVFRDALESAYVAAGKSWFITIEEPITDKMLGNELGRNDLRAYLRQIPGQDFFFSVECKRLHVTTASGFKSLVKDYIEEGVQRFIDGKYPCPLQCAGMLGYVMDDELDDALTAIHLELVKQRVCLKMKGKNSFCIPSCTLPSHRWSLDTFHSQQGGKLTLHHLLVGVVRKKKGKGTEKSQA